MTPLTGYTRMHALPQSPNSESTYTEWRHKVGDGLKPLQHSLVQLFQKTQLLRIYSSTLVPGLLQTEGWNGC
jgi:hypothetical protein